ncbi:MAG: hypothetical protein Q8916_09515 [Bacteroidota bacterium]|nr:hypothetical protein [Bacteroidota bacterium]
MPPRSEIRSPKYEVKHEFTLLAPDFRYRYVHICLRIILVLTILQLTHSQSYSQKTSGVSDFEETPIEIWHRNIGTIPGSAVIDGKFVYIQPIDVFHLAKIRADISDDGKVISGYYIEEVRIYTIDLGKHRITYKDEIYPIAKDQIIETASGTFLRCDIFEQVFNLKCIFNFNNLAVEVQSGEPLPAESEAAADKQRQHLQKFDDSFVPDKRFGLQRSLFSVGTLDYQAGGNYIQTNKAVQSQYNILFGGQLLGGDFDAALAMAQGEKMNWKNVPWQWRTGIENSNLISQIIVGKRATFSNLSLPDSMLGVQITNAKTGYQPSFANYTISDRTEPNWTVELYINDLLVNYVKADQTGYYKFVIPLSYGSTNVLLKFHGPYGEVRTQTVQLRIPYTFLPPGNIEYTATAGTSLYHPGIDNSIGKLDLKFGVSTAMTGGGGLLYQHDADGRASYSPYATSSLRIAGMLLGGEYYHGSGYRASLNITSLGGISVDAEYDRRLSNGPAFGGAMISDQAKLQLSAPLPILSGSLRLSGTDVPMRSDVSLVSLSAQTLMNISGASIDLSANYGLERQAFAFRDNGTPATGSAGISMAILNGLFIHPSASLDYTEGKVTDVQIMLTKAFASFGTLSMTGGYSFATHDKHLQADFRMNLPFAQVGVSGSGGTGQPYQGSGSVQGSLGFDMRTGSVIPANHPEVRRGGLVLEPFLDLNNNGSRESSEPLVKHFGFEQAPGKVDEESDGRLRVSDMEPYRKYTLKTSCTEVENISWVPKFSSFEITPGANGYTCIQVPVTVAGQIEGYVYESALKPMKDRPLGGARIKICRRESDDSSEVQLTEDLLSYSNGEFYYMGITPGKYRVCIDPKQLAALHYSCEPPYIDFEVSNKEEGDSKEGLNFILKGGAPPSPSVNSITKALR